MLPGFLRPSNCCARQRAGAHRSLAVPSVLAYRLSGSVPDVLANSRLSIDPDRLRLEVSPAARAPDSEVVAERLKLLAAAMGIRRFELTEPAS